MSAAVSLTDAFVVHPSTPVGVAALQGLTLTVEPGELVVVLGPSGSGKTTLLRVLAGLERLSAGSARVFGTELAQLDPKAGDLFRAANIGLLDQHYGRSLSADLSCRRTVALQLDLLGHDAQESLAVADRLLEQVGLGRRAGDRPGALSGGEQQRVAVCAAVAHRPGLLLADEPAGELDAASAGEVYRLLGAVVRDEGATALVVSHDAAAATIADRVVEIRDGRLVEEARPGGRPSLVVGRSGWVRLPEPLLAELGRPHLVTAERDDADRLVLAATERGTEPRAGTDHVRQLPRDVGTVVAALRGVTKSFGSRTVFDGISRDFAAGVLTAVVGRSGSGKTTLLHLLAGLERPTGGEVLLDGESLRSRSRGELADRRRRVVALVTQEPGLVPYLSALENVELGLRLRGAEGDLESRARDALVEVGLGDRLGARASRLSAGERQRVAIARALATDARLLLVDEPTARLDAHSGRAVAELLAAATHERGLAVVCATHDAMLVELADERVRLDGPEHLALRPGLEPDED